MDAVVVTAACCGDGSSETADEACCTKASLDATWQPEMTCTFPGPDSYAVRTVLVGLIQFNLLAV